MSYLHDIPFLETPSSSSPGKSGSLVSGGVGEVFGVVGTEPGVSLSRMSTVFNLNKRPLVPRTITALTLVP